tara:strand:- start:59 stop:751 length:693 start_codon:yes stop_codon:yes gene_type:complete
MSTKIDKYDAVRTDGHDIDRTLAAGLDEAEGVLGRYVETDTLAQRSNVDMTALVSAKVQQARLDIDDAGDRELAIRSVQNVLKERAVNELTRLDRVFLDLDGSHGNQAWCAEDMTAIVFCAITSADKTISQMSSDGPVRALAVYFDAKLAGTKPYTMRDGTTVQRPDQYNPSAYTSIVATFGSVADAELARVELAQAVQTIARPMTDSALQADPNRADLYIKSSTVLDSL